MSLKNIVTCVLLFLLVCVVKAHYAGLRLLLIAVAGLAGLYMIHILATDYQKIQSSRPKLLPSLLFKRSISDEEGMSPNLDSRFSKIQKQLEQGLMSDNINNQIEPLDVALNLDPLGCAQWYVCELATRPSSSLTSLQATILNMIRNASPHKPKGGAAVFQSAITLGETYKKSTACTAKFRSCSYSITEMLKLIQPVY